MQSDLTEHLIEMSGDTQMDSHGRINDRQQGDLVSLVLFLQNKIRLKDGFSLSVCVCVCVDVLALVPELLTGFY